MPLPLRRAAWEVVSGPAVVYGPGTNNLPMVHVSDRASDRAACAARQRPHGRGALAAAALVLTPAACACAQVSDLASYIAAAASEDALRALPETQQYLLCTDCPAPGTPGTVEQGALIRAVAERLGTGEVM